MALKKSEFIHFRADPAQKRKLARLAALLDKSHSAVLQDLLDSAEVEVVEETQVIRRAVGNPAGNKESVPA